MRVDELVRSLLRRPLALLLVVAIGAACAYLGYSRAQATYESTASVVIVPPADGAAGQENPLTRLDFSIAQLALVVSNQLKSDPVAEQVASVGGDGGYTADTLSSSNAAVAQLTSMIALSATSSTKEGAVAATDALVKQASAQLASVQTASGVPEAAQARIVTSSPASAAAPVGSPQVRAAGVFGLGGAFLALLAMVLLTAALDRRAQRRSAAAEVPQEPAVAAPEVADEPVAIADPQPGAHPEPAASVDPVREEHVAPAALADPSWFRDDDGGWRLDRGPAGSPMSDDDNVRRFSDFRERRHG